MSRLLSLAMVAVAGKDPASILVVDDEPDIGAAVQSVLTHVLRANVHVEQSGQSALKFLRESKVDLMVTDFKMPGMNGIELIRRVRESHPDLPIVLITAFESELMELTGGAVEADRIVYKPLDARPFINAVKEVLVPSP